MKIVSSIKLKTSYILGVFIISALLVSVPSFGQLNNTFDNSSNSNTGLNANQFGNGGQSQGSDQLSPNTLDPSTDPGGPTDPIDDLAVPLDGGITLLIAIGIASGYRRRK